MSSPEPLSPEEERVEKVLYDWGLSDADVGGNELADVARAILATLDAARERPVSEVRDVLAKIQAQVEALPTTGDYDDLIYPESVIDIIEAELSKEPGG